MDRRQSSPGFRSTPIDLKRGPNILQSMSSLGSIESFQVAIKNDVNVFYFATTVPLIVYFREDGQMEKREFLEEWKSIPEANEQQFTLQNTQNMNADAICTRLQQNNIHTVARRQVDNQQLLYHSVKYTNNLNVLSELKVNSQTTTITLSLKSKNLMAIANINEIFQSLLN
ncbi:unnamed protein product [Caenorhabditis sp. 36 PRJEB53466]|nr:unnamed protein product [Caenorhabditis sp. 36 PRJEB53466]